MDFDFEKFLNAPLNRRTKTFKVPDEMASFFPEGKPVEWVVRNLDGPEFARVKHAANGGKESIQVLQVALDASRSVEDRAEALQKALEISETELPSDYSMRIELLSRGTLYPPMGPENRDAAIKIGQAFPTLFYSLTQQILTLTGKGCEVGKPKRSGETEA